MDYYKFLNLQKSKLALLVKEICRSKFQFCACFEEGWLFVILILKVQGYPESRSLCLFLKEYYFMVRRVRTNGGSLLVRLTAKAKKHFFAIHTPTETSV
jgi:hypothetical protein